MKRILALTLSILVLFACISALSACRDSVVEKAEESFPNAAPQKAKDALLEGGAIIFEGVEANSLK